MIIVTSNGGQLCNKLWSYTALIAYSLKFRTHVFILDFDEYSPLFLDLNKFFQVHFLSSNWQKKMLRLFLRLASKFGWKNEFVITENSKGISQVCGWDYRSEYQLMAKYKDQICEVFKPKSYTEQKCNSIISKARENNSIIVGVHIRRGDYKTHFDGAYYFENDIYAGFMQQIQAELMKSGHQSVVFLLCAAEKIALADFKGLSCIQIPKASAIDDLYSLSLCNYILGVPSSFSMWASFVGEVPVRLVQNQEEEIELSQFKSFVAVDTYSDGSLFVYLLD